jgi:hypothetical protein
MTISSCPKDAIFRLPLPLSIAAMDLYLKAGPDGSEVGDCPFAHYVRNELDLPRPVMLNCRMGGTKTHMPHRPTSGT